MGKFRGKQVKCPICQKVQYTEGSIYFVCCGKTQAIDLHLYESIEVNTDIKESSPPTPVSSDTPKIKFSGGNIEMTEVNNEEEETLTCADCGAEVQDGQKFCGNCRKELDWS